MSVDAGNSRDKTRLCPTCRMEISILATKCRYCGENVGRPRDEARQLTVKDLGGESIKHYVPPSSVMEALESFRAEEETSTAPAAEESPKRSYFGFGKKKAQESQPKNTFDDLPDLDSRSQNLASAVDPGPMRGSVIRTPASAGPSWMKKVGVFAGLVAAIVILYLGSGSIWAYFNPPEEVQVGPKFVNPAMAMIKDNRPACEILEAAVKAEMREPIPENEEITGIARQRVVDEFGGILNAPDWSMENVTKASGLAGKAWLVDPSPTIADIVAEADRESIACRMNWGSADPDLGTATLRTRKTHGRIWEEVTVKKGELINERFELVAVYRDRIEVIDRLRNDRRVSYGSDGEPRVIR